MSITWAKAGMVVRNDLTKSNETLEPSSGYAIVAVTPENGFVFQWDSNGDGLLDKTVNTGKTNYPAWLKLERDGTTYTASYRTDGGDWKTIHSATIPSASETQDVGLFVTATNAYKHGTISKVIFADFDIKHP